MLVPVMYEGGVYKYSQITELVEDLGGYILQKNIMQTEVKILILVPADDLKLIEAKAKELLGEINRAPLTGTEIATVGMTLTYHHYPHLTCDVAEFMRKQGAKTNMIGLARGVGIRIAQLNAFERDIINEHDVAIFMEGNYKHCIREKAKKLYDGIEVPVIVTGASDEITAEELGVDAYIGNFGRLLHQLRHANELSNMDHLAEVVGKVIDKVRIEIEKDPLSIDPPMVKKAIEDQVPEVLDCLSPLPIALQLRGARVKLPYHEFHEKIENVRFVEGNTLSEIAEIRPSVWRDYTLIRILPESETGFRI